MNLVRSALSLLVAVSALSSAPSAFAADTMPDGVPRPVLNYRAMDRLGWKLSCQAYTFREMTLFETIDTLHNLGIRYIELFPSQRFSPDNPVSFDHNSPPAMVDALIRKLKSADVTPVSYGVVGIDNNEANARKIFEFAKKLHLLNIVAEPPEDAFGMLDRLCHQYRINIAIHDHPRPSHYWNPDTVLKVIYGHSNRIGSCSDTGHWYRSGLWPVGCLQELRGHIIELHFKDLSVDKDDRPWGTGVCDASGQLVELRAQRFKGVFSIEYESTNGAVLVSNVAKCCQYFSDMATKLSSF